MDNRPAFKERGSRNYCQDNQSRRPAIGRGLESFGGAEISISVCRQLQSIGGEIVDEILLGLGEYTI